MPYAPLSGASNRRAGWLVAPRVAAWRDLAALPAAIVKPRAPAGHRRSTARGIGRGVVSQRMRARRAGPRPARRLVVGSRSGCREIVHFPKGIGGLTSPTRAIGADWLASGGA